MATDGREGKTRSKARSKGCKLHTKLDRLIDYVKKFNVLKRVNLMHNLQPCERNPNLLDDCIRFTSKFVYNFN